MQEHDNKKINTVFNGKFVTGDKRHKSPQEIMDSFAHPICKSDTSRALSYFNIARRIPRAQ